MKKVLLVLLFLFFTVSLQAQFEDRFNELEEDLQKGYSTPLATWTGTYLNSGGYYSASVSKLFGFKFSLIGMMIFIPEDQQTFKLDDGTETATFFGEKGAALAGTSGYLVYPPGINQSSVPTAIPQIAVSTLGTELMLRYIPSIDIEDVSFDLFGIGVKHSISQYIPLLPVDIAVQIMYNKFALEGPDLLIETSNIAFNAHASRSFGLITLYGGLQYESTTLDLDYTFIENNTGLTEEVKASIDGDNGARLTLGAALRLAVLVFNADVNIGSQTVVVAGLNFEF
jgi:uncharacterized protein DUF6588